jgi:2-hydroxy-3-keto-5-methylthiopentenyl-1-phosphate phosphatase
MLPIGAVLVDFDGTACLHDAANHLLMEFGDPSWPEYDAAWARGEIGSHEAVSAQAAMLRRPTEDLVAFAVAHCPLDPTFEPFVRWLDGQSIPVTIVSDGFGFYVEPILRTGGVGHVPVLTNTLAGHARPPQLNHPNGHPECRGCGTCKMLAAVRARERLGPVAFVGEGQSDRYGALYSDIVFAKKELVRICREDGVPFLPWETFDDVRQVLEDMDQLPGPVAPQRCPGWRTA